MIPFDDFIRFAKPLQGHPIHPRADVSHFAFCIAKFALYIGIPTRAGRSTFTVEGTDKGLVFTP